MHVIKGKRRVERTKQDDVLSRTTGRMQAQKLIDLIDESAPDEGVVDVHALEMKFADGTRRIEVAPTDEGAVVAIVEGAADTTRRMSAVEWDAAVAAVESEVHSESTMRMSAIQANELAALITPVEVSLVAEAHEPILPPIAQEPIVTFTTPRILLPLPAPIEEEPVAEVEIVVEPAAARPRATRRWMIGALIALAGAAAGLVAVAVSYA